MKMKLKSILGFLLCLTLCLGMVLGFAMPARAATYTVEFTYGTKQYGFCHQRAHHYRG